MADPPDAVVTFMAEHPWARDTACRGATDVAIESRAPNLLRGGWRGNPPLRALAYVVLPWTALLLPAPWSMVGVAVAYLVTALVAARDRQSHRGVWALLAALTVCDVSPFTVDGSVVRFYQLAAPLVLALVVVWRRELLRGITSLSRPGLSLLLLVVFVTVLTGLSIVWTISVRQTLISTVGQVAVCGLLLVYAGAVRAGVVSGRDVLTAVWSAATLGSAVACAQFLVTVATPLRWAVAGGSGIPWPRPTGLMTESVWAALVAAMALGLSFAVRRTHPRLAATSWVVNGAVVLLVLSRAVILGMIVAAAVAAILGWRRRVTWIPALATVVVAATAFAGFSLLAPGVVQRFDPRLLIGVRHGTDGGSASSRVAVFDLARDEIPRHLPWGAGAGSSNQLTTDPQVRELYLNGGELNSGRGSTNFYLGYVFDFGYLGALVAIALTVTIGVLVLRAARVDHGLSAYLAVLFLVDFQFNNGFRFGFVHVLLAALVAQACQHGATSTRVAAPGSRSTGKPVDVAHRD